MLSNRRTYLLFVALLLLASCASEDGVVLGAPDSDDPEHNPSAEVGADGVGGGDLAAGDDSHSRSDDGLEGRTGEPSGPGSRAVAGAAEKGERLRDPNSVPPQSASTGDGSVQASGVAGNRVGDAPAGPAADDGGARSGAGAVAQDPGSQATVPACDAARIRSVAADTVEPLLRRAAELHVGRCQEIEFVIDSRDEVGGFGQACSGLTDVVGSTRYPSPAEREVCAENQISLVTLPIGFESVVVATSGSGERPSCLNYVDLYALFGDRSVGFERWSDANGLAESLGSSTSYPNAVLTVVGPAPDRSLHDRMQAIVFDEVAVDVGESTDVRSDLVVGHDAQAIVAGIAAEDFSLGWGSLGLIEGEGERLWTVPLARRPGAPCVAPSETSIIDGSYPAARPVLLTVALGADRGRPEIDSFIEAFLTIDYEEAVVRAMGDVGFVTLPSHRLANTVETWRDR